MSRKRRNKKNSYVKTLLHGANKLQKHECINGAEKKREAFISWELCLFCLL